MLFWSSFQYSIHVVINFPHPNGNNLRANEAYLESDKFKMYFVSP